MTGCCRAIDDHFDATKVCSQLDDLEKSGPADETRLLVEQVMKESVSDFQVLDIGAGLGVIAEQLLAAGARQATLVELSTAYADAARRRLAERGHSDRVTVRRGDFLELAAQVGPADVVTLDKVICCYPDMHTLVDQSASKALKFYAASYPRDHLMVRIAFWFENSIRLLRRNPFRTYVHAVAAIERRLRANGFELHSVKQTFLWRIVLFKRTAKRAAI